MARGADPSLDPNVPLLPPRNGGGSGWMQDFWNATPGKPYVPDTGPTYLGGGGFDGAGGVQSNAVRMDQGQGLGFLAPGKSLPESQLQALLNGGGQAGTGRPQGGGMPTGGDSPTGNNGYSAAAAVAAMLKGIEESYLRQVQGLDKNKATANTGIQNAYNQFKTNTGANNDLYQQGASQITADVAARAAQSLQQAQQANQQIQQSVGGLGGNVGALQAQAQGNELALQGSNNAQQDLTARIAQIVAANNASTQSSGDLVRQGAVGNLENNYTDMMNALMSSKEQQTAQANQSAYSGGGGSADVNYKDAMEQAIYKQMFGDYNAGNAPDQNTAMNNLAFMDPVAYITALINMQNGQQPAE